MPRFYFNYVTHDQQVADLEGSILPDITAAKIEALADIEHLLEPHIMGHRDWTNWRVCIADESGRIRLEIPFSGRGETQATVGGEAFPELRLAS